MSEGDEKLTFTELDSTQQWDRFSSIFGQQPKAQILFLGRVALVLTHSIFILMWSTLIICFLYSFQANRQCSLCPRQRCIMTIQCRVYIKFRQVAGGFVTPARRFQNSSHSFPWKPLVMLIVREGIFSVEGNQNLPTVENSFYCS